MSSTISCPHSPACSGCDLIGTDYSTQIEGKLRAVRQVFKQAEMPGFDVDSIRRITPSPQKVGYRNRVKLVPAKASNEQSNRAAGSTIKLGLYREGSHEVVDIPGCPVHSEGINRAIEVVRAAIRKYDVCLYDESTHSGDLRFVTVREGSATGEILVGLVTRTPDSPGLEELAGYVIRHCEGAVGVVQNINGEKGNVIFGPVSRALAGREHFEEIVCGVRLRMGLMSFFQVNTAVAQKAYEAIVANLALRDRASQCTRSTARALSRGSVAYDIARGNVDKQDTLLDLYCGVGAIGLVAAGHVGRVIGIDSVTEAVTLAGDAASTNGLKNVEFHTGLVEERLPALIEALQSRTVAPDRLRVVMNPPRKGLDSRVVEILLQAMPGRVAYLSCSPTTLACDVQRLVKGGYRIRHVELFDMFPQTQQVETLAILEPDPDASDRPIRRVRQRRPHSTTS